MKRLALSKLEGAVGTPSDAERIRQVAPDSFAAASRFWEAAFQNGALSPRVKELILIAVHGSATSLNATAIERHIERAMIAGATEADILDVLLSVVGVANHAMYFALPIFVDEMNAEHPEVNSTLPELQNDVAIIREDFIKTRGFWNEQRDLIARLMPDYFKALSRLSAEPWKSGALTPKERELIYIAIDCSVTHMYEPGLRMHIRHARQQGATQEEILETMQLAALPGMEGYVLGCHALNKATHERDQP